ncbi:Uncharacterized protein SCF082_LOCUS9086 [Durusdinium trenchii]
MSQELIEQLKACSVALGEQAELLQQKIKAKANKNKDYADLVTKVEELRKIAKERVTLAKALIRAVDKPAKAAAKSKPKDPSSSSKTK